MTKKILIASDHAGFDLKDLLVSYLKDKNYEILDLGPDNNQISVDYPLQAKKLTDKMTAGEADSGILVCGSGIGMCIAANRVPNIRAALVYEKQAAELARRHNDANVLCLGGRMTDFETAKQLVDIFLTTPFDGDRHTRRVQELEEMK